MSCHAVVTRIVAALANASSTSPTSMIERRPTRSASGPKTSISPPKVTAYAPTTHCNVVVEAVTSRPMVGRATFRIEFP
ncbi:hypothetical protein FB461_0093 [Rarobacter faecitabidus]|uniref:Uncharacterized protein n=1 Tax=Rarobacter faecitabidus TaxID=13243 RepID=A0A542ZTN5_RARFA|nr:hypothetical protein FB461_0093 [Rarobacter faecitabidus]